MCMQNVSNVAHTLILQLFQSPWIIITKTRLALFSTSIISSPPNSNRGRSPDSKSTSKLDTWAAKHLNYNFIPYVKEMV